MAGGKNEFCFVRPGSYRSFVKPFRGRIGVFGGSFDPPHIGHVMVPSYLLARGLVDRVLVAPTADHPLKRSRRDFATRLRWTRLAMQHFDNSVEVSDIEAKIASLDEPSYALRLLDAVQEQHPEATVRLVIGSDIVHTNETRRWHRWDEIERRYAPIVVPRAGFADPATCVLPRISSTDIRRWVDAGDRRAMLEWSVPDAVLRAMEKPERRIVLVGRGHVSTRVARWLDDRGWTVTVVSSAVGEHPWSDLRPDVVWVLTRDNAILSVAGALAGHVNVPVLHAAGARCSSEVLAPLRALGIPVGTLHPICALRREVPSRDIEVAGWGVEGDPLARTWAESIIEVAPIVDLQGLGSEERLAYHAACALVANHLPVLLRSATGVLDRLEPLGDSAVHEEVLMVLLKSAVGNLADLGVPTGVTGPASRGDWETVSRHIHALERVDADVARLYRDLSDRLAALLRAVAT